MEEGTDSKRRCRRPPAGLSATKVNAVFVQVEAARRLLADMVDARVVLQTEGQRECAYEAVRRAHACVHSFISHCGHYLEWYSKPRSTTGSLDMPYEVELRRFASLHLTKAFQYITQSAHRGAKPMDFTLKQSVIWTPQLGFQYAVFNIKRAADEFDDQFDRISIVTTANHVDRDYISYFSTLDHLLHRLIAMDEAVRSLVKKIPLDQITRVGERIDPTAWDEVCPVCLEDMRDVGAQTGCVKLSCGHSFHAECLNNWICNGSNTCPVCRCKAVRNESTSPPVDFPLAGELLDECLRTRNRFLLPMCVLRKGSYLCDGQPLVTRASR